MSELSIAVGRALRRARNTRGLTLHEVRRLSDGAFKPSAVGAYERGERQITVERFCDLSHVYGMSPDRLLLGALATVWPESRASVVVHLDRLGPVEDGTRRAVADFVADIHKSRGEVGARTIVLRAADLDGLAVLCSRTRQDLIRELPEVIELS